MPIVRTVVRSLIAGVLAIVGASVAGPALAAQAALAAHAQDLYQQSYKTTTATSASGIAVAIDSLSPRYVSPSTSTIEVKGTVTNHTGGPVAGVQVQLLTTGRPFTSRSLMEDYANGGSPFFGTPISAAVWQDSQTLHSGSTIAWTISFPASAAGFTGFGVFPLEAESTDSAGATPGLAHTLLPYWPGSSPGAPAKLDIAWVWPLIDTPQQGPCSQALTTNDLAASLALSGRLGGLLSAGASYAAATRLTWAIDPALLSDAAVMTSRSRYKVGGNAQCTGTRVMPRSAAAGSWLSALKSATAGSPMFLTPYADADVSALTHAGLDKDIAQAYTLGNEAASGIPGTSFKPTSAIAWPDGGFADESVLTALAHEGHVRTTVLSSAEMPVSASSANPYEDNAVASVPTGIGTQMNVLLADSEISTLLGSATAASSASSQFAVTQDFLAETAMIVAEAPNSQRSVVIAPPSRWDPSASEAGMLLSLSSTAPWLQSVSLDSLAGSRVGISGVTHNLPPSNKAAPLELGREYLSQVAKVGQKASRFAHLLADPRQVATQMEVAVGVAQSAAWRGRGSLGGRNAIKRLRSYLDYNEGRVRIISGTKVLLAGTSGAAPVSVSNGLPVAVRVKVQAIVPPGSLLSVSSPAPQVIPPNQTVIFRLQVHSAPLGSTFLQLQLQSADGKPLAQPPHQLDVETTRFGRTLLILIAAALGVLVLTSVARWIRRWLRNGGSGHHVGGGGAGGSGTPGASVSSSSAGGSGADFSGVGWSSASGAGSGSGGTG
jgi:hypothetical protein